LVRCTNYNIVQDLVGNVRKIAEFQNIPCSTEFVQEVAEKCTFDNLKKNRIDPSALFNVGVESSLYRKGKYIECLIGYSIPFISYLDFQDRRLAAAYTLKSKSFETRK
jgi:hypothetical protein